MVETANIPYILMTDRIKIVVLVNNCVGDIS